MGMNIGGWLAIFMKDLHLRTDSLFNFHAEGTFYKKKPKDAIHYLDKTVENSNTWIGPIPMDSTDRTRTNTTTSSGSDFKKFQINK